MPGFARVTASSSTAAPCCTARTSPPCSTTSTPWGSMPAWWTASSGPPRCGASSTSSRTAIFPEDGIVGPQFLEELALMVRATHKAGRDALRERVWLRSLPPTLAGQRVFVDASCRDDHEAAQAWDAAVAAAGLLGELGARAFLSRSADTRPPESLRALQANELAADMVLGFSRPGQRPPRHLLLRLGPEPQRGRRGPGRGPGPPPRAVSRRAGDAPPPGDAGAGHSRGRPGLGPAPGPGGGPGPGGLAVVAAGRGKLVPSGRASAATAPVPPLPLAQLPPSAR